MIYLDYWCLLNFAPEASTFLPTLFSSSVFLTFSPLPPKRTQKSGLFSKREGRGAAWSEENFPSTDGLSWRRETVGGKNKVRSLITFPEDVLIQGIGHMKLHTSFKTKSHRCLGVGTSIEDRQRNLQHDIVKELRVWGQRSWFLDTQSWENTLVASFHHP